MCNLIRPYLIQQWKLEVMDQINYLPFFKPAEQCENTGNLVGGASD